ncbi:cbb3-type cytochrome oxidase assembly protein CcoS [Gracilimonas sp. Q87]|jgi:cbb3-type cytochrome oxidase maturation protein|uniref:cbb3-type cytochrome oxidase assembly protein CcoS n=1 Tax=Gracilimonas sp. Q87 TaxID=3384766 RepID=UPI0039840DD9
MEVIYMLIGFSLLVALIFLGLFFWAVRSGQFDDQYTPSMRVLFDKKSSDKKTNNQKHRDE